MYEVIYSYYENETDEEAKIIAVDAYDTFNQAWKACQALSRHCLMCEYYAVRKTN